jgi:hypothetical protein
MKKIRLINEFHNTEATVMPQLVTDGRFKGYYRVSRKTAMRLRRELCGVTDCCCGGPFGERGGDPIRVITEEYDRSYIVDIP